MTNETRDLDRACAEAMGWSSSFTYGCLTHDLIGIDPVGRQERVPCYSTDPSTQAEKLRWLHANWALCVILGHYTEKVGACAASPVAQNLHAEGATIDEALARLVCAVAKAKKEQGK